MANYYTQLCFEIKLTTDAQREWWLAPYLTEKLGESGFEFEVASPTAVYIWSDEFGQVEDLADFLQGYLTQVDSDAIITFEWANTCSKMRFDSHGGGCCAVSATEILWLNTATAMGDLAKKIKGEKA